MQEALAGAYLMGALGGAIATALAVTGASWYCFSHGLGSSGKDVLNPVGMPCAPAEVEELWPTAGGGKEQPSHLDIPPHQHPAQHSPLHDGFCDRSENALSGHNGISSSSTTTNECSSPRDDKLQRRSAHDEPATTGIALGGSAECSSNGAASSTGGRDGSGAGRYRGNILNPCCRRGPQPTGHWTWFGVRVPDCGTSACNDEYAQRLHRAVGRACQHDGVRPLMMPQGDLHVTQPVASQVSTQRQQDELQPHPRLH